MAEDKPGARQEGESQMPQYEGRSHAVRVVLKFQDHINIPYEDGAEQYLERLQVGPWDRLVGDFPGIRLVPLYTSVDPKQLRSMAEEAARLDQDYQPPNLLTYFAIDCPPGVDPEALAKTLSSWRSVQAAYVEAGPTPPPMVNGPANPRYPNQGYLGTAPGGIDASYAWGYAGGDGAGMGFVDCEQGWTLNHEDLQAAGITLISGVNTAYFGHGTAVLGEVTAVDNTIGDVGIVPHVAARVISQFRPAFNTSDAIIAATASMSYGDVLLLEAQTTVGSSGYLPVETETATFDAIRLATSLGVVVVEAGGNGSNNLDAFTDAGGNQVLNRSSSAFKDSGAIMVGAASSTTPHSRLSFSNYGSRIDCYGWGGNIDTTGDGWTGNLTTTYTGSFAGTSGASPIVAGAAVAVQGLVQASRGYRFSPRQLRALLTTPANSTASANPSTDLIGVMPNLRAIIQGNTLNLAPDIYLRDFVGDTGDPRPAASSRSPDIILKQAAVPNPQVVYGQGSGTENNDTLSDDAQQGHDNYIYVRLLNRGGSPATSAVATVYWSPPATLVTPNLWTLIGSVTIPTVPVGNILTVSNAITWPQASIPAPGHYCFIGLVGTTDEPAPSPGNLLNWNNFLNFIRFNNNAAWRNFNVVPPPPSGTQPPGYIELPFLVPGAPEEGLNMELEVIARLPEGARVLLEAPLSLLDALKLRSPYVKVEVLRQVGCLPLTAHGDQVLGEAFFSANSKASCRLLIHLPTESRQHVYEVAVRQLFKGEAVGRVTWQLASRTRHKRQEQK